MRLTLRELYETFQRLMARLWTDSQSDGRYKCRNVNTSFRGLVPPTVQFFPADTTNRIASGCRLQQCKNDTKHTLGKGLVPVFSVESRGAALVDCC